MSRTCAECDQPTGPGRRVCKQCSIEERHGTPADHLEDNNEGIYCWVQDLEESWHASMYFEGDRHVTACGEILECPVADVRDDPRRIAEVLTCDACEAALEADEEKTVPDGGEFSRASELRADGSGFDVQAWVLENITEYPVRSGEPWSSRRNLKNEGRKNDGVEKADVRRAIARLANADEVVIWHGLVAHANDETLNRIIELERDADITRKLLISKCNKIRKRRKADAETTEREVATDGSGHRCDWCGVGHPTIAEALRCCSEDFDRRVNSRPRTDGGSDRSVSGTDQSNPWNERLPQIHAPPVPIARSSPSGQTRTGSSLSQLSHTPSILGICSRLTILLDDRGSHAIKILTVDNDTHTILNQRAANARWNRSVHTDTNHSSSGVTSRKTERVVGSYNVELSKFNALERLIDVTRCLAFSTRTISINYAQCYQPTPFKQDQPHSIHQLKSHCSIDTGTKHSGGSR